MLLQFPSGTGAVTDPVDDGTGFDPALYDATPLSPLWGWFAWSGWWLYVAFMIWMVISCIRHDPERHLWIWIIIFLPFGPVLYFFARWIPNLRVQPPRFLRRFARAGELKRLQIAAQQIGNAHQFVEWGEALRDAGKLEAAGEAFRRALMKDGNNLQALWGAAWVDFEHRDYLAAREKLDHVLQVDPAYKFGDVSLLYAKTLHALGEAEAAREHLEGHTRRWRHPEGLYLLACLYAAEGETDRAREKLEALILDLDGAPRAIVRRQLFWKGRARKLLRRLPSGEKRAS